MQVGVFFLNKQEMTCVSEASKINSFPMLTDGTFRGFLAVHKLQKEGPPCFVSRWGTLGLRDARRGQNIAYLRFLSKERWGRRWRGCGGKDDIEKMRKMWPFWDSCGLRNISNPRSEGGPGTGWRGDAMCLLPALHWKHALLNSEN